MSRCSAYFNPPATGNYSINCKINSVSLHIDIYRAYMWLNSCAYDMVRKMDAVLDDRYHQEVLMRGTAAGYRMPGTDIIRAKNDALRQCLNRFDGNDAAMACHSNVRLPATTVRGLYEMAILADDLVDDVFHSIKNSDYMLMFRAMKVTGEVYDGAMSLQEVCNAWAALWTVALKQAIYPTPAGQKLPVNWVASLS